MTAPIAFEVRIPACDRPHLLRRALDSLRAQEYPHWTALVLDDSLSPDVEQVVRGAADERISYRRNGERLGAARNIDQCFSPVPLLGGHYGCLLEDDNFWLPGFLSLAADRLNRSRWRVAFFNQRISDERAGVRPATETTRGGWLPDGRVDPISLRATLFFIEGLSNGGLVWALDGETNLQVGGAVQDTGLHEACRSLLIREPFLFVEEAQAVWTWMPKSETARTAERHRLIGRGMQSVRDFVLRVHGEAIVRPAASLAQRQGLTDRLIEALAYSGHPRLAGELGRGRRLLMCRAFCKGVAIRLAEQDPCAAFLRADRPAAVVLSDALGVRS